MAYIVAGLMKDAHQARGAMRALEDDGFEREDIDIRGGPVAGLAQLGVPEVDAHILAEGVRRGGAIVTVRAHEEIQAEQAALTMARHGAVDIEACAAGWRSQGWNGRIAEPRNAVTIENYALIFGDYPDGAGTIYHDPRARPERRHINRPFQGADRRAA